MPKDDLAVQRLGSNDLQLMDAVLSLFARAFNEDDTYNQHRPKESYIHALLSTDTFIALAALHEGRVVGAAIAYELKKFEQERSEIYVYDLAVDEGYRRRGVATAILRHLSEYAVKIGAHAVFVQADKEDHPAIALYDSLGKGEEVLHFDLHLPKLR
jgi:aminoglycoside 3-N-acetyltransferase I